MCRGCSFYGIQANTPLSLSSKGRPKIRGWHHGCLLREAVGGGDGYYPLYPCPLDGVGGGAAGAAPVGVGCVADRAWFEVAIVGSLAVMSRVVVGVLGRSVVALICMCGEQRAAVQLGG